MGMTLKSKSVRILVCAMVVLAAAAGCRKKETEATITGEAPAVPVRVMEVKAEAFAATVPMTGTLVSRSLVTVKGETTGRLLRFPKQEGDAVQAGEAVAWVDDENYRLALDQARAAVQVAEAALARTRVAAEHALTELERARNLIRSGGITDRDLKAAEVSERDARAQVALAQAQLDQARAALPAAEKRLRDTVIRAPIAGVIETKFFNPGAYIEPPTQMFTVVDNQKLELESAVPATDLAEVRAGQRVRFRVASYPETLFEGRVVEINPSVDPMTRSAKVRIGVDNSSGRLKAGMFAQGDILTGAERQAIIIPPAAAYRASGSGSEAYVFVVENGKAARRAVQLGREAEGRLEVVSGLKPGEVLIAEQRIELADGVAVAPGK